MERSELPCRAELHPNLAGCQAADETSPASTERKTWGAAGAVSVHRAPRAEGPDQEKCRDPLFTVGIPPQGYCQTSLGEARCRLLVRQLWGRRPGPQAGRPGSPLPS